MVFQPETSELTFTNLFIWRARYGWQWSVEGSHLILLSAEPGDEPYFLQPVGPPPRTEISLKLLRWLREERSVVRPRIERADRRLAAELASSAAFRVEPTRDHFDYLYASSELIALKGSRYHAKRNHLSRFAKDAVAEYAAVGESNLSLCADFQDRWCERRRCSEDLNLLGEWQAVKEALINYPRLGLTGGAFLIGGRVEAFAFGELLNKDTAVIHIEKANPEIPGLYAAINQRVLPRALERDGLHQPRAGPGRAGAPQGQAVVPSQPAGRKIQRFGWPNKISLPLLTSARKALE